MARKYVCSRLYAEQFTGCLPPTAHGLADTPFPRTARRPLAPAAANCTCHPRFTRSIGGSGADTCEEFSGFTRTDETGEGLGTWPVGNELRCGRPREVVSAASPSELLDLWAEMPCELRFGDVKTWRSTQERLSPIKRTWKKVIFNQAAQVYLELRHRRLQR